MSWKIILSTWWTSFHPHIDQTRGQMIIWTKQVTLHRKWALIANKIIWITSIRGNWAGTRTSNLSRIYRNQSLETLKIGPECKIPTQKWTKCKMVRAISNLVGNWWRTTVKTDWKSRFRSILILIEASIIRQIKKSMIHSFNC